MSLVAQRVKSLPAMRETQVWSLGREDTLEKMATHSSTLAWKIPWTEEPGRLQSMGSKRVGHDWATSLRFHFTDEPTSRTAMEMQTWKQTYNKHLKSDGVSLSFLFIEIGWSLSVSGQQQIHCWPEVEELGTLWQGDTLRAGGARLAVSLSYNPNCFS